MGGLFINGCWKYVQQSQWSVMQYSASQFDYNQYPNGMLGFWASENRNVSSETNYKIHIVNVKAARSLEPR